MVSEVRRRLVLLGSLACIAAGWQVAPKLFDRLSASFDFEELNSPKGYRKIRNGDISSPLDVFAGLETGSAPDLSHARQQVSDDLKRQLFASATDASKIQIAYFSDFYCPYCRILSSALIDLMAEENIEITWHETPIFGEPSVLAARAAIAAAEQDAYVAMHDTLVSRPVVVTQQYLNSIAAQLGLNVPKFSADMFETRTQEVLNRATALSEVFRFVGTPAMVVGRTAVQGRISMTNLRQLIALERKDAGLDA